MYHRLVAAMKRVTAQLSSGGTANLGDTGAIVEGILERFMEDSAAVLGLAMMRDPSEADLFHSVNTMIYALTIGVGLEIPQEGLNTLGVCALLHDIGKLAFDRSDPAQAERIRALHPRIGAEILSSHARDGPVGDARGLSSTTSSPTATGWPEMEPDYIAHPYSRMVGIADRYDRLTTDPSGRGGSHPRPRGGAAAARDRGLARPDVHARVRAGDGRVPGGLPRPAVRPVGGRGVRPG